MWVFIYFNEGITERFKGQVKIRFVFKRNKEYCEFLKFFKEFKICFKKIFSKLQNSRGNAINFHVPSWFFLIFHEKSHSNQDKREVIRSYFVWAKKTFWLFSPVRQTQLFEQFSWVTLPVPRGPPRGYQSCKGLVCCCCIQWCILSTKFTSPTSRSVCVSSTACFGLYFLA